MKKILITILFIIIVSFNLFANVDDIVWVNSGETITIKGIIIGSGNDDFSGTTSITPKKTILDAVNLAVTLATETIYVAGNGNTYDTFLNGNTINDTLAIVAFYDTSQPIIYHTTNNSFIAGEVGTQKRLLKDLKIIVRHASDVAGNLFAGTNTGGGSSNNINFENCNIDYCSTNNFGHQFIWSEMTINFYNCIINARAQYGLQRVKLNIYNTIFSNVVYGGVFDVGSSSFISKNSIIINCSATSGSYNLTAGSTNNIYQNNTGFGTYGANSLDTDPAFVYDYFISDTSPAKFSGSDGDHRGLTQETLEYNATNNTYSSNNLSVTFKYGVFETDTIYNIIKSPQFDITICNEVIYNTSVILTDSRVIIGQFAYASQTTETPVITSKLNGFLYNVGDTVILNLDAYKGFDQLRVRVSYSNAIIFDEIIDNLRGQEYDITSELSSGGYYYYTVQPYFKE